MSSAEIEVQLTENNEAFHIKVTLSDPDLRAKILQDIAKETVAVLMGSLADHNSPANI